MRRSGLADSPLFSVPSKKVAAPPSDLRSGKERERIRREGHSEKQRASKQPSNRDTATPRSRETTVSRYHDTIIELVRKAVKEFGKEAATHRFTTEEKKAIADIIYSCRSRGIRTNENEITRIAVNFILDDHRENGENSILDRVLRALNG